MSIVELMNLRTEFEEIVSDFKIPTVSSDINSLNWFIENGHKSNSLRNDFQKALFIAREIIAEYKNVRTDEGRYSSITEDD